MNTKSISGILFVFLLIIFVILTYMSVSYSLDLPRSNVSSYGVQKGVNIIENYADPNLFDVEVKLIITPSRS